MRIVDRIFPQSARRPAELFRLAMLVGCALAVTYPFFTSRFLGGTDARWYAFVLKDFLDQVRSGHFPVIAGQGPLAWNGGVHPFRSAPLYLWLGGAWDLLTLHRLDLFAVQHMTVLSAAVAGALGFYFAATALAPRLRWEAFLISLLYLGAPSWLSIIYSADAYMTFMAFGALPLVLYGNARSLLGADGRGYAALAAGLVLIWMCHPPVAALSTAATILIQGGAFALGRGSAARINGAWRGALIFAGLGAYYFVSMAELPPRPGSPPIRDVFQILGLALALTALAQGLVKGKGWRWLALLAPAGAMLWFSREPWFWWMVAGSVLTACVVVAARGLRWFDPGGRGCEILLPCFLVAAGIAEGFLGPDRPGRNLGSLWGLGDNAAHLAGFFLPVSGELNQVSDYQPGLGVWFLLAAMGVGFFRRGPLAAKLFFTAGLLPALMIVRVPWVSDFLAAYFPDCLAGIVNFPLVLRLAPVLTGFVAMGAVVWLACESEAGGSRRFLRLFGLSVAAAWCASQSVSFVAHGLRVTSHSGQSRDLLRSENFTLDRFAYDLLPIPSYYSNGAADPRLEFRLFDGKRRLLIGPDGTARRMEGAGASTLRLTARSGPGSPQWRYLSPGLTLAPGERVLLRFEFNGARKFVGRLIFQSEHGYREYFLPGSGLARAFGTGPSCSKVVSLWNSGSAPEHWRFSLDRAGGDDLDEDELFATLVVSRYDEALNPVRVDSWVPLRLTVDAGPGGWLETTRVFIPGYRVTVDGSPAPAERSAEGLLTVPLTGGHHSVEVRMVGSWWLWVGALVTGSTLWLLWRVAVERRRAGETAPSDWRPEPVEEPLAPSEPAVGWWAKPALGVTAAILAVAAVVLFECWTIGTSGAGLDSGSAKYQYYPELVEGFRKGHLYMDAQVSPALLAVPEAQRPGSAPYLLDASLYQGHYYLYFGVVPAVLLFWPYEIATGLQLAEPVAGLVLAAAGLAFGAAWWLELRRRCFPALGWVGTALGVLAIGFCSVAPSALRRPSFYEVAITSGYAFSMAALWAASRALLNPARARRWLVIAGIAAGLAVGSRANLGPGALVFLAAASLSAAWVGAPERAGRRRAIARCALAAGCGFGAVAAGLAAYNFARFGNPLEFGHNYQIGQNPQRMFHAANLRHNLEIYYFSPPELNGYFPFVAPADPPAPPPDYIGREHAHGEWIWLPVVGLALAAGAWTARRPWRSRDWGWAFVPPVAWFAANLLVTGSAGTRANRYMLDFHPALVLATLLALAPALSRRGDWASLGRWVCGLAVAAAIAFNALASMQVHGFFPVLAPLEFERLSDRANRLVWPWLRGEASAVGDREMVVRWPGDARAVGGKWEPLLATGTAGFEDVLWVNYDGAGNARLIFEHGEYGSEFGEWFALPTGGVSHLRISGAFLLPGIGHPWYGSRPYGEQSALKRHLKVLVDGAPRFDRDAPSYDSSPHLQHWGWWRIADSPTTQRFSGSLESIEPAPVDDARARMLPRERGAVRLVLTLPQFLYGYAEPILQSGSPDAFDTLAIKYVDPHTVQLIHDCLGSGDELSDPIGGVDYNRPHRIEVELPFANDGLRGTAEGPIPTRAAPERMRVRWDGREVFESRIPLHPAAPESILLGGSLLRSSTTRMMYSGTMVSSPREGPLGAVGPGTLECRLNSWDPFGDDRGVVARFERSDGEAAALVWRRSAAGLQLGWTDADVLEWSSEIAESAAGPDLRIGVSEPQMEAGLASAAADVTRSESIEVGLGDARLLSATTDIFSAGPVQAYAIVPGSWSGSALASTRRESGAGLKPAPALPGRIRIRFRLPPFGLSGGDPILSAGHAGKADSIYLRRAPTGRWVLGLDHWGIGTVESQPQELADGSTHTLFVEMGSLFASEDQEPRDLVRLVLDGKVVLSARMPLYPVRPGEVVVGRNPLGMSTSNPEFRGEIIYARTRQPPD